MTDVTSQDELARARLAAHYAYCDLAQAAEKAGLQEDDYPLKAILRAIEERDHLREQVAQTPSEVVAAMWRGFEIARDNVYVDCSHERSDDEYNARARSIIAWNAAVERLEREVQAILRAAVTAIK